MNNVTLKHIASAIGNLGNILVAAVLASHLVPTLMGDPVKAVPWSVIASGIAIWFICQLAAVIILMQLKMEAQP